MEATSMAVPVSWTEKKWQFLEQAGDFVNAVNFCLRYTLCAPTTSDYDNEKIS
jgi:hypothetical protein